eukprot:350255-Chlamydomonas_euryale.AAC.2
MLITHDRTCAHPTPSRQMHASPWQGDHADQQPMPQHSACMVACMERPTSKQQFNALANGRGSPSRHVTARHAGCLASPSNRYPPHRQG